MDDDRSEVKSENKSGSINCLKDNYLNEYYAQNARKLRNVVGMILCKFSWITDYEHFYSLANEIFVDVYNKYDGVQNFHVFLYSCLSNKIKTEITRLNRYKRTSDRYSVSIDAPINSEEDCCLRDILASDYCLEDEIFEDDIGESRIEIYLNRLSKLQRKIVELLAGGYKPFEIKNILHINEKEYLENMQSIHAYENVSVLYIEKR